MDLVSVTWARDGVRKPPMALIKNVKYSLHFNAETIELDKENQRQLMRVRTQCSSVICIDRNMEEDLDWIDIAE